ncbi:response regulator [bacterium]|nr:response regulator [bacterium]
MKKKILYVEDEAELRKMLKELFLYLGYDVELAVDGEDGINKFREFKPDLLISDIKMPKKNGLEMVSAIRETIQKDLKVFYISGWEENLKSLEAELKNYPDYHFARKPFNIAEIIKEVEIYIKQ